ncbi:MAG: YceI family protein [Myxococcales bacterium]
MPRLFERRAEHWCVVALLSWCAACSEGGTRTQPEAVVAPAKSSNLSNIEPPVTKGRSYSFSSGDSAITFVAAKVTRSHQGSFGAFHGTVDVVSAQPEQSSVRVEIEMASIQTDEDQLTGHLKKPDLLDVAKYPKASFVSTSITKAPSGPRSHLVTGDFELHGVRKSIQFPADIRITEGGVEADGDFTFKRQDFGITYPGMPDDLIKDDVVIKLKVRAKPDAA